MVPASRPHQSKGAAGDVRRAENPTAGLQALERKSALSNPPTAGELSTALKWSREGELSALDLHRILSRLALADPVASHLSLQHFGMVARDPLEAGQVPAGSEFRSTS